ncbi:MAG: hypothetical protein AAF481_11110 [Acidobacteriota bacterium]
MRFRLILCLALWGIALPVSGATLVVANKSEATVSLVDLKSRQVVATLPTGDGPHEVAISPDGTQAVISNYGRRTPGSSLTRIDIAEAKVIDTIDLGDYRRPHGMVYLDDQRILATAEDNQALIEVALDSAEVVRALPTDQEISHMVAASPDGKHAFVTNIGSNSLTAFDLSSGERRGHVETGDGAEGLAIAPDGLQVWVTNRSADTVSVVDAETLDILAEIAVEGFPIRLQITPDGATALVSNARGGNLAVLDTAERKVRAKIDLPLTAQDTEGRLFSDRFGDSSVPIGIVIEPSGKRAYVAHTHADRISVVDLESGERTALLTAGKEPDGMGWTTVSVQTERKSAGGD